MVRVAITTSTDPNTNMQCEAQKPSKCVRFVDVPMMGTSTCSTIEDAADCWYTSQELKRMGAQVRLDCCRFLESLHRQCSSGTAEKPSSSFRIPNDSDDEDDDGDDGDEGDDSSENSDNTEKENIKGAMDAVLEKNSNHHKTSTTTGLDPYVDASRGRVQTEVIQAMVKHSRKIYSVQAKLAAAAAPCETRHAASLLLAEVSRRLSRSHRLGAFEEGHVLYCELYPERVMGEGSTGHWEAYRRILQRQAQRHAQLYHKLQVRQQQQQHEEQQGTTHLPIAVAKVNPPPPQAPQTTAPHIITDDHCMSSSPSVIPSPQSASERKRRRHSATDGSDDDDNKHNDNVVVLVVNPTQTDSSQHQHQQHRANKRLCQR